MGLGLQENRLVSEGMGRKHVVKREVEENNVLQIKCSSLALVSLLGMREETLGR